ncbi:MAG: tRNA-dihydrouridine synthase family protein [Oligoflexales bacterium]|nr:tRNA-dihydrouridine synthase family protein [Oligoflexales bacterium]
MGFVAETTKSQNPVLSIGLAPMEGVTDFATRLWYAKVYPPEFMSTPFFRVSSLNPSLQLASKYFAGEFLCPSSCLSYKLLPQVMADTAEVFSVAAEQFLSLTDFVDLNCGCPSKTVTGRRAGSRLLEDAEHFAKFVTKVETRLGKRKFSVKMRTGYAAEATNFSELISSLQGVDLARVTVHGRTRLQKYTGCADWNLIALATKLSCEVFGSGDIVDLASLHRRIRQSPTIQGVIVGRGALRNPWIFQELYTEKSVELSFTTLCLALQSFAVLQQVALVNPELLVRWLDDGHFLVSCKNDEEKWQAFYQFISSQCGGKLYCEAELKLDRRVLGRVKMLWNYMRSCLPQEFFGPEPLRSKDFTGFLAAIASFHQMWLQVNAMNKDAKLQLKHRKELDWVYAGAAVKKEAE